MLQQQARTAIEVAALTPNLPAVTSAKVEIATLGPSSVDQGNCRACPVQPYASPIRPETPTAKAQRTGRTALRHPAQGCIGHR